MHQDNTSSFHLSAPHEGIVTLTFDVSGQKMNTLKPGLELELQSLVERIAADAAIEGVVFASGKQQSFIAGADIDAIAAVHDAGQATRIARALTGALDALDKLWTRSGKPVVAAIDGPCLGGGLELALACSARVVTNNSKTTMGLPETKLGLIPGGGGTQRLPRRIGVANALDLILTGKNVRPDKALKLGLVDDVVAAPVLLQAAHARAKTQRQARTKKRPAQSFSARVRSAAWQLGGQLRKKGGLQTLALEQNGAGLRILFHQAKKTLQKKTGGHYPALLAAVEAMQTGLAKGMEQGLRKESELFGKLVVSPEARALIGLYHATQNIKKDAGLKGDLAQPRPVRVVGVVGAGQMGAGIAQVTCTAAGLPVRMQEKDEQGLNKGIASVHNALAADVRKKRRTSRELPRIKSLLTGTTRWQGVDKADVVIEAVFEDLKLKQQILAEVERRGHDNVIFASNTSSIPIADIAATAKRPENVVGMHYFSPVEKMPLLEIIAQPKTSAATVATCVALGRAQGKTVIVVNDGPGFYTTRILSPYLMEAAWLIGEGARIEDIDRALVAAGFPVGPVTLMDEVGLDTGAKVCKVMHEAFGERIALPPGLDALIADKRLGRKNGRGFFRYENGKKGEVDESVYTLFPKCGGKAPSREQITQRVLLQMVNEAARCLEEGKLRSVEDGDVGAIFGLGFPPFLGGPFQYIDSVGAHTVVKQLEELQAKHGERFAPAKVLRERAASRQRFYA